MPVIKPGDFGDHRVKALLTRHLEDMHANSPPGHVFALDWSGLQKPEISFYALWEGEDLLGFGALKELGPRAGEIKSMRTADAHLRRGVAATILDHIIAQARQRGYTRLSLETGSGPAFEAALKLYRKYGFTEGGAFDGYEKSPFNQFLHLDLVSTHAGPAQTVAVGHVVVEPGYVRSETVVIAKLAYARPAAADAEYLPAKAGFAERHTGLRDDTFSLTSTRWAAGSA